MRRLIAMLIAQNWPEAHIYALLSLTPQSRVRRALNAYYRSAAMPKISERVDAAYAAQQSNPSHDHEREQHGAVMAYVQALVRRRKLADPEAAIGDVLLDLCRVQRKDDAVPYSAFIAAIVRNKVNDAIRRERRAHKVMSPAPIDPDRMLSPADEHSLRMVESLPLTQAERVLIQLFVQKPDYAALARDLRIKPTALRNRLQRLKQKIVAASDAFGLSQTT